MSVYGRAPRLLFVNSGLGGLTVLSAARSSVPEADVLYIADDAGFPYGSKSDAALTARLFSLIEAGGTRIRPGLHRAGLQYGIHYRAANAAR